MKQTDEGFKSSQVSAEEHFSEMVLIFLDSFLQTDELLLNFI